MTEGSKLKQAEAETIRAAVVYGSRTRQVFHVHQSVTFGTQKPPSDQAIEQRALELAARELRRSGLKMDEELKALAVDPDALVPGLQYRVDQEGSSLIAIGEGRAPAR